MGTIIRHTRLEVEPNGSSLIFRDLIKFVEEAKRQSVPERADVSLISGGPMSKPKIRISWGVDEDGERIDPRDVHEYVAIHGPSCPDFNCSHEHCAKVRALRKETQ